VTIIQLVPQSRSSNRTSILSALGAAFLLAVLGIVFASVATSWAFVTDGTHVEQTTTMRLQLSAQHARFLQEWLVKHAELRPANLEDCENRTVDSAGNERVESCRRLIQELREWTKDSAANPFFAHRDFNGDSEEDFAVVLTERRVMAARAKRAIVVVFNGPFRGGTAAEPAFSVTRRSVSETFLGYGPPRPKPWRLIIGLPESEGMALVWRNGRYALR
jgi:hypothetical protein